AILDLPPFSNLANNVMWIDDFLKYSLHRAMNHFISGETLDIEPALRNARLDDVMVTKARPANATLADYIFSGYIPTLFSGKTFACYWAEGTVRPTFGAFVSPLAAGIAPGRPLNKPITDIGELDGQMVKYLEGLIRDTIDYVRWTLYWPQFVQVVRSIRQGKF